MTTFQRTNSDNPDFKALVVLLDRDLAIRDGEDHSFYDQFNKIVNIRHVIVCYDGSTPIACGAFKKYDEHTVEIKRMFVLPQFRGHGLGGKVLQELELWAMEESYATCILETGKKQPEAIALYKRSGYSITKNYGQYEHVENSVCMKKQIV
ncbi:MAG: GNAT family N-acetyltransferase [Rhizobacter sp.]|nr:GNAT family N-acetyltransferase [Ferruginibacter sp.]